MCTGLYGVKVNFAPVFLRLSVKIHNGTRYCEYKLIIRLYSLRRRHALSFCGLKHLCSPCVDLSVLYLIQVDYLFNSFVWVAIARFIWINIQNGKKCYAVDANRDMTVKKEKIHTAASMHKYPIADKELCSQFKWNRPKIYGQISFLLQIRSYVLFISTFPTY